MPHMPEERYRCRECQDSGWVDAVDPKLSLAPTVHPCRHCRKIEYRRWKEGHLSSDHRRHACPECFALDTGALHPVDYLPDGSLPIGMFDS